ncbi:MAG: GIY-YIG nuclease family protein [Candidatus Omnitrophica bacterium]|nr:GIY-YIG nuclease family protein [Candidatus Omnitrophota bacterium]
MWSVYIVECKDGSLYTGITDNLVRRIKQHNCGHGCRFTKYRKPVMLLYSKECVTKGEALRCELKIKGFKRDRKLELINSSTASI